MVLCQKFKKKVSLERPAIKYASIFRDIKSGVGRYLNMAVNINNKVEIRTKLVLKHSEKENYYLFVREDKNKPWSLPTNILARGQTIEDGAKRISSSVCFHFRNIRVLLVFEACFICFMLLSQILIAFKLLLLYKSFYNLQINNK